MSYELKITLAIISLLIGIVIIYFFYKKYKKSGKSVWQGYKESVEENKQNNLKKIEEFKNLNSIKEFYKCTETDNGLKKDYLLYLTGHPEIIKSRNVLVAFCKDKILLFDQNFEIDFKIFGEIIYDNITDVTSEDKSYFEKKTSAIDVIAFGPGMAKMTGKEKEMARYYVGIDWKQGKFSHTTIFSFEGKNAISNANEFKSRIIKYAN